MVKVVIGTKVCSFEEMIEEYNRVCEESEKLKNDLDACEGALKINQSLVDKHEKIIKEQKKQISELESELAVKEDLLKIANSVQGDMKALKRLGIVLDEEALKEFENIKKSGKVLEEPLPFSNEEYDKEPAKINLNDIVKVKLTPYGAEIYYHQFDEINKQAGRTVIEPHMPEIDKDGYTQFQLHHFVNLYGEHIRMCNKNVIEPLDIILCG